MFVLVNETQFQPEPPRGLMSSTYSDDFNAVKALGRGTGSTRTIDQTALAPFWEGNASVHWNQAANQIARANHLSMSHSNRLLALLNIAMADTAITIWSAKRFYGGISSEVTWRPATSIPLADIDGNPDTVPDLSLAAARQHAVPSGISCRASQPQRGGRHGSAQPLQRPTDVYADDDRTAEPHVYEHRASTFRREQCTGLGRHALPEHGRDQRRAGRVDRGLRQSTLHAAASRPTMRKERMLPPIRARIRPVCHV